MTPARRFGAILVSLAAALAAYAALGSGLDRMSRAAPALAAAVPPVFRSQAWRTPDLASAGGLRSAVLADPLDPAASSALGLERLAAEDGAGALAAFRVSGRLGWRDWPTQLFWLGAASEMGEPAVAVERLDALLRQDVVLLEQPTLLAGLEASRDGRRALASRLASRPPWFGAYWNRTHTLSPDQLAARARVLDEPRLRAARIGCGEVRGLAGALMAKGRLDRGQAILGRYCAAGGLLADGGFDRARLDDASPLGWRFTGAGGLDLRFVEADRGNSRVLSVASALPYRTVFAAQPLQLAPGRYRVTWRARSPSGPASPRIAARLGCDPGAGGFVDPVSAQRDRWLATVALDAACPAPTLELAILPGIGAVIVDDVTLDPLG